MLGELDKQSKHRIRKMDRKQGDKKQGSDKEAESRIKICSGKKRIPPYGGILTGCIQEKYPDHVSDSLWRKNYQFFQVTGLNQSGH